MDDLRHGAHAHALARRLLLAAAMTLPPAMAAIAGQSATAPATPAAAPAMSAAGQTRVYPLTDTTDLTGPNVNLEAVEYQGRKAVKITAKKPGGDALAVLAGTDFQDGTIEADFAVKVPPPPPGGRMPGFIGVAFRARPDTSRYELFYLRPGNARSADQAMRNHAVQYSAAPDFSWYVLRRNWPAIYESYVDLQPETWTHLEIEVKGRGAKLFVGKATQPVLVVDGLKGEDLRGAVALSGYANQESYFSNVRVTAATPEPVKNGGEAAGTWQVRAPSDVGPVDGTLTLTRDGKTLSGTWSGMLGKDRAVSGTWRDGYVELWFTGEWTKERGIGKPGEAVVTFAGWIDGDAARGRMKVDGRADGPWTATRTTAAQTAAARP